MNLEDFLVKHFWIIIILGSLITVLIVWNFFPEVIGEITFENVTTGKNVTQQSNIWGNLTINLTN